MLIAERMTLSRKLFKAYREEFEDIFKLKLEKYLDITSANGLLIGFDIVQFDIDLGVSAEISCSEFVENNYGARALEIIQYLLA